MISRENFRHLVCTSAKTVSVVLCLGFALGANADEGMWPFNSLPLQSIKSKYGFEATPNWINHVMRSSVRVSAGGSGSFVSADGLILTNHHVAADALHNVSTPEADYIKNGFYASTLEKEIQAPGLYVDQLEAITDVSARVKNSIQIQMSEEEMNQAKQAEIEKVQTECQAQFAAEKGTETKCQVVTLYLGGAYHLYRYKRYSDIRIAFAPEVSIAFFGGDPDNFEFPRYDLDMTLLRAYQNGKPAKIQNYLPWTKAGVSADELVFVSGNPGSTQRLLTLESLVTEKNWVTPFALRTLQAAEKALIEFGKTSDEAKRRAEGDLFGVQNSRKVVKVQSEQLDDAVIQAKARDEANLMTQLSANPELSPYLSAWEKITKIEKINRAHLIKYAMLEQRISAFNSRLFARARTLVRAIEEKAKPNSERLSEFTDSNLPQLEIRLFSKAPIYKDVEEAKLAASLRLFAEYLANDPLVDAVMQGKSPEVRAHELTVTSVMDQAKVREEIYKGGASALEKYKADPMIQLAKLVDASSREVRKVMEERVSTPLEQAYAVTAQARFAVYGSSVYPDATFTARLSYGAVKGYTEKDGTPIAPFTTMGGAFKHEQAHGAVEPYLLPDAWQKAKDTIQSDMPFNFVSTNDIIGGNSGSPVINARGELVGLIFDGNIHSIMGDFFFDPALNRSVSVDARAMLHAMDKIYHADTLVRELTAGQR